VVEAVRDHGGWALVVVIPARDEELSIGAAVASVAVAVDRAVELVGECRIVVVADSCADATEARARAASSGHAETSVLSVLPVALGNVGAARAAGVTFGSEQLARCCPRRTWIANTDADTVVPSDWIVRQLRWAERGWAAVAGVVDVDDFDGQASVVPIRFRATYTALGQSHGERDLAGLAAGPGC
jgi:glycosyltransferase involved in cell wall biosynthesis